MYSTGDVTFGDDVRNWFDRYLGGRTVPDMPAVVVADQTGWARRESSWPPDDTVMRPLTLRPGTYMDAPGNAAEAEPADTVRGAFPVSLANTIPTGAGIWTFTRPLPYEARMSGDPRLTATLTPLVPGVHLVGLVYDVAPDGTATLVTRGAMEVPGPGTHTFELYPTDWHFAAGHRIGVLVTGGDDWWFEPGVSGTPVAVGSGVLEAPFLLHTRATGESPRYRSNQRPGPITVDPSTFDAATVDDPPPPQMQPR